MKSPLLQAPLPVCKQPLPTTWITKEGTSTHTISVKGIEGEQRVPAMIYEAIQELDKAGMWAEMGFHCIGKMSGPGVEPRPDIAVLALMLRYSELNYIEYTPC